jgi:cytidylate kinase
MGKPNISDIVERQVRFWDVRERLSRQGGEEARAAMAHLEEGPWISISKEWGSGARVVATKLAETLDWQAFDKEIVSAITSHTGSLETIVSRLDQHAIGSVNDYLAQMAVPADHGQASYLKDMVRVVSGLAKNGNAIVVGRGANFFLRERFGLRVRLVAPLEARVRRIAAADGVDEQTARQTIARNDDAQRAFIRQVFLSDIADPIHYDLVINTEGLGLDATAVTIRGALRSKLGA